ncbi:hypothetical protein QZH41_001252 [Actinostola sp. cb2023]|nr:hypothetical protein QZH41_001252 [Actinostola sp. cb2023]
MLLVFDALAKKHGWSYWIKRGTLLGAARHRGFMPWDTDLDIELPIKDYLEFVQRADEELPSGMILQHHTEEQKAIDKVLGQTADSNSIPNANQMEHIYWSGKNPWNPRLRDDKSCYKYCLKVNCQWHDGILIDMYPVILKNGRYTDHHFDPKVILKPFPLKHLKFEGFDVPVPNEWQTFLRAAYGENYMDLPPFERQRVAPEDPVPDPVHSCAELEEILEDLKISLVI